MIHRRFPPLSRLALGLALAGPAAACSSTTSTVITDGGQAPPVQGTYTVVFPSLSTAVYTQTLQVMVFAQTDAETQCLQLLQLQHSQGTLPATVVPSQPIPICQYASAGTGSITVGFGSYAVLVVAQRGGTDLAVGCTEETISAAQPDFLSIAIELVAGIADPPPTTCTSLTESCGASGCP